MKYLFIICFLGYLVHVPAQNEIVPVKDMSELDVMIGTWEGEGWIIGQDRSKKRFRQTEVIKSKVNGTVLTVDGLGYELVDTGMTDRIIHDVVGILSINPESGNATMFSILETRGKAEVDFNRYAGTDTFVWSMRVPARGTEFTVRFVEDFTEKDVWKASGEVEMAPGQVFSFFEMTLRRQN